VLNTKVFPKKVRLRSQKDFQNVFQSGKKFKRKGMAFIIRPNHLDYPRLGVSISKKSIPRSVDRNRMKRIVKESFRLNQEKLEGIDVVVVVYSSFLELNNAEMNACLNQLWSSLISSSKS
jgi:ribonuclease P protein component